MVVQHNMQAANANRMLNVTTSAQSKSTEKLSSGYRINRAADDAAGLTISEKMRKQIKGLDRASTNAQDGVSAVQTAEGALTEVHSMLQRMNELATQAANGTNSTTDRQAIQDEIDQLTTEIDRVSETTKFNEMYLLKGNSDAQDTTKTLNAHDAGFAGKFNADQTKFSLNKALTAGDKITIAGKEYEIYDPTKTKSISYGNNTSYGDYGLKTVATAATVTSSNTAVTATGTYAGTTDDKLTYNDGAAAGTGGKAKGWYKKGNSTNSPDVTGDTGTYQGVTIGGNGFTTGDTITLTARKDTYTAFSSEQEMIDAINDGKDIYKGNATTAATAADYTSTLDTVANGRLEANEAYTKIADELKKASSIGADTAATVVSGNDGTFTITKGTVDVKEALSFNLHVGADADTTNKISVKIDSMSSAGLGIKGIKADTEQDATYAIDAIADAISTVSSQRSSLGAVQNRLEHTINNLDNVVENTTSAESRIRDTDMAKEMVNYSKNNILAQAGQSMLAQANQSNQGVLSLLQ